MSIVYDMSDTDYHAHEYVGSTTAKLCLESPQLMKDSLDGLCGGGDKPHYAFGRLAHMMVLEPKRFARSITSDGPINPKTEKMYGRGTVAFTKWQEENPYLTVIEPELYTMLERMPAEVRAIFAPGGVTESSVFVDHGLWGAKCRPDHLIDKIITDLKTIDDINNCEKQIANFGYYLSASWYRDVMKRETGLDHTFRLVFVEKNPPFRWRIVMLDDYESFGDTRVKAIHTTLDRCFESGDWSDKGDILSLAYPPEWLLAKGFDYDAL